MAQIQNFGFIAQVQKPDVQHAARPRGGPRQSGREPAGAQYALRPQNHTGALRARPGRYISVGYDHLQLAYGAVLTVQIPASESARPAEYPHFRRLGHRIYQKTSIA